jgi:hypothetical protein
MFTVVLGMTGCDKDKDSTASTSHMAGIYPPCRNFNKKIFDESLEAWTEQGILDYSFDVWGYEFAPNTPSGDVWTLPSDAKFYAHVTVADGGIVSIENIVPSGERFPLGYYSDGTIFWSTPFSLPGEELGAYTWGAIPDIFDRLLSISIEDASSPYVYDWYVGYGLYSYPSYIDSLAIRIFTHDQFSFPYPTYPRPILLYKVELNIKNFQITENL